MTTGAMEERVKRFKAGLMRVGSRDGVWLSLTSFGAQGRHRWGMLSSGLCGSFSYTVLGSQVGQRWLIADQTVLWGWYLGWNL